MYICVCVKQTPDSSSVYVDPITGQVDYERFVQVLNPADACAVEAAVRLREQVSGTIKVLTLGPKDAEGALRAALAIGADSALRLWNIHAEAWGPFAVAAALAGYLQSATPSPDLVLCGDSSSDWSSGIVGPALAQQLDLPQVTSVAQLKLLEEHDPITLQLTRKLERGYRELLEAELPLIITVTGGLNEPRYPSLPAHLAALKAEIPVLDPHPLMDDIWLDAADEMTLLEIHTPRPRPRHISAPDSRHSAYQRIGEIVAGGATGRKTQLVKGSPEELAKVLVEFLRNKEFI
ncbi:MAG TPA: electron transfer flavoprotein subunit beta/FixA family protein [Ktedonobacteraceae bacterium]